MQTYRRVRSIALYDAGTIIANNFKTVRVYEHPFHHEDSLGCIRIEGDHIEALAEAFGIKTLPIKWGDKRILLRDREFEIGKKADIYGSDSSDVVKDLFARIDGPQMLSIRIIEKWEGESAEVTREISYCGRFSIEWDEVEQSID